MTQTRRLRNQEITTAGADGAAQAAVKRAETRAVTAAQSRSTAGAPSTATAAPRGATSTGGSGVAAIEHAYGRGGDASTSVLHLEK